MKIFIIIAAAVIAVVIGVLLAQRKTQIRDNFFSTTADALGFRVVSTKYASGLAGTIDDRRALVMTSSRDVPTMHVLYDRLQLYLETDFPADTDTTNIDKTLLARVPEGMELRSGASIFAGSSLELVMKEAYGSTWNKLYLVATPSEATAEAISKRFGEMNKFASKK